LVGYTPFILAIQLTPTNDDQAVRVYRRHRTTTWDDGDDGYGATIDERAIFDCV